MRTLSHKSLTFSSRGKVIVIVSLFVAVALLLQGLMYLQSNIFSGVRAYVRGEGLWAKSQKDAIYYLTRYSYSQNTADFAAFEQALIVIEGDTLARNALKSLPPNLDQAQAGFLQGQNHPDDVPAMIWFFQHFQNISYMHQAIDIWQQADASIARLRALGLELQQVMEQTQDPMRGGKLHQLRDQLAALNSELTQLEIQFSSVLGEGARWVRKTVQLSSFAALLIFVSIAIYISLQISKGIARAEQKLRVSEARFRSLKESGTIGIVTWHREGGLEEANERFLSMLGYTADDLAQGRINWRELTPPEWQARDRAAVAELRDKGRCAPYEKAYWHKDGQRVPVLLGVAVLTGEADMGIAFVLDQTEQKQAEEQVRLAATVFSASHDGILITDANMHIVSVNQALCQLTGFSESELLGQIPPVFQSNYTAPEKYRDMLDGLYRQGFWEGDLIDRTKSGELLPVRVSISGVKNNEGSTRHYVAIISDNSVRKAREDELRQLAHHDMLTGLPNRTLFKDRCEQAIKRAQRSHTQLALIFVDLDDFKPINDRYGHLMGDKLLQIVAQRLLLSFRGSDTIARLGGDEFVILLEAVVSRDHVANSLRKAGDNLGAPCVVDGEPIDISVSAGFSLYPDDGRDMDQLICKADQAMYSVKKRRKNGDQA